MTARIYVGTYSKYNSGSLKGAWLDLEDYADAEDFYTACAELHADENDPEFMFQDWEGIPAGMVGESFIKPEVWEWLELDEDDQELLAAFADAFGVEDATIEQAREAYAGQASSEVEFVEQWLDETGELDAIPESLRCYFDYEKYARDAFIDSFYFHDETGRVFWRNW